MLLNLRMKFALAKEYPSIATPSWKRGLRAELRLTFDPLAESIRSRARFLHGKEGGSAEYRIYPDKGESDTEIQDWIEEMWERVYSPFDCTGDIFTTDIHWARTRAGIVVIHYRSIDI